MKKLFVITSIILLTFVTANLLSFSFNHKVKGIAHAVENTFDILSVKFLPGKYISQESYYAGKQDTPPPLPEPFKMFLLGLGFIVLADFGRKRFKN
jgi:hypothetical protein